MMRVLGGYELLIELGWASIGSVHAARRTGPAGFRKRVAVEVLEGALAKDPEALQRYLVEVGRAAEIDHPNVVQILEVGEVDGGAFVVQEFVDGCPLDRLLDALRRAGKRLPAALAARALADACEGVAAAHGLGIVHGDLGPDRMLLGFATGQVKVCGFGGASARPVVPRQGTPETRLGCAAPESFEGAPADGRSDVFALGAVLYRASLGRVPFSGQTDAAVLHAILKGAPVPPTKLDPAYPPALEETILRALAVDPSARHASATEVGEELARFLETTRASHASVRSVAQNLFPPTDPERAKLAERLDPVAGAAVTPAPGPQGSDERPRRVTEPLVSTPVAPTTAPSALVAPVSARPAPAAAPPVARPAPVPPAATPPAAAPPVARPAPVPPAAIPPAAAPPVARTAPAAQPVPATPPVTVTPPSRKPLPAGGQVDLWSELDRLEREFPSGDS